jgi:hypothetical protein
VCVSVCVCVCVCALSHTHTLSLSLSHTHTQPESDDTHNTTSEMRIFSCSRSWRRAAAMEAMPSSADRTPSSTYACQHASAYASIRQQHTSTYVSIRQQTPAYVSMRQHPSTSVSIRQHTPAYASIRQHTPAYVSTCSTVSAALWKSLATPLERSPNLYCCTALIAEPAS